MRLNYFLTLYIIWITLFIAINGQFQNPEAVAVRAVNKTVQSIPDSRFTRFGTWSYEGGTIIRGLWENQIVFDEIQIEDFLHQHLNYFQENTDEFGYQILNDYPLEGDPVATWGYSIGDKICLFPIAYVDRLRYAIQLVDFNQDDDLYIVDQTVNKYVYGFPFHLDDGTISRPISWVDEGYIEEHGTVLWVDDMFMGTALTSGLSYLTGNPSYVLESAKQLTSFQNYLVINDPDALYHHGYNNYTGDMSCCKWGRGNGWSLMAKMDALDVMEDLQMTSYPEFTRLLNLFVEHCEELKAVQSASGGWPNILTNNETYIETSSTAMFLTSFIRGVERGWLDSNEYSSSIDRAWNVIAANVEEDGTVTNIQPGTGIKDDEAGYEPINTNYEKAGPGLGAVLRSIAAAGRYYP